MSPKPPWASTPWRSKIWAGDKPTIEVLAQSAMFTSSKLSAIAALGCLGGPEQASNLRQMEGVKDETVLTAVRLALRQLAQKEALF